MQPVQSLSGWFEVDNEQFMKETGKIRSWITVFAWSAASCFFVAVFALGLHLLETSLSPLTANAAHTTYDASVISSEIPATLPMDGVGNVKMTFKNTGSSTWFRDGKNYVSIYRYDTAQKREIQSVFAMNSWISDMQPVRLAHVSVSSGGVETLSFPIKAPSVSGTYKETFILTAENAAWIKNGMIEITVRVEAKEETRRADPGDWGAELVEGSGDRQMNIDEHAQIILAYKNTGKKTWMREGPGYISLYAVDGRKERTSAFMDPSWFSGSQAAKLKEAEVKPGEIGHVVLQLRPKKSGMFQEAFALAAEDKAWIPGGALSMPINVLMTAGYAAANPGTALSAPVKSHAASLLLRSAQSLRLVGNARQDVTLGFKNTGQTVWNSRSLRVNGVAPAVAGLSPSFRDSSWTSSIEPVKILGPVNPGEIGFMSFKIKAPPKKGSYSVRLALHANEQPVEGSDVEIPVTVTEDGVMEDVPAAKPQSPQTPAATDPIPLNGDEGSLLSEPIIRVGIYKTTDDKMSIRAREIPVLVQQNGSTICRVNNGETATVSFDRANKVYKLDGASCAGQSAMHYVFRAEDGIAAMELADFSRPVAWLPGANDNTFRAHMELRYTPQTENVWVINELPIEWYLKGIAETSNSSPQEYQRALLTAARTYAMYHVQRGTKHANEYYTVDAKYDQVYRGYGSEARSPAIVAAVSATRGQIVTYNGKLALTPYYSRSDGRTRAWTEVWGGGPYAWLVSVPVPWDQGRTLWGHGVGLSATGALGMASDGKRYEEILRYFYSGTELRKAYR